MYAMFSLQIRKMTFAIGQRAFAIEFCTSSLRTEMESKHCLEKILGPNANGPVKFAGQASW